MTKEKRDDSDLHALICPFCQMTNSLDAPDLGPVLAVKGCQLVGLNCKYCGKYMDEKAIDHTYREYFTDDDLGLLDDDWDEWKDEDYLKDESQ